MTMPLKIECLYAWIGVDPADGSEGVPAAISMSPDGTRILHTLVGADLDRTLAQSDFVRNMRAESGAAIRLVKFTQLVELNDDGTEK